MLKMKSARSREKISSYPRYELSNHGLKQYMSMLGRSYQENSASLYEIRWHQDGPEHWSEYAHLVAESIRQPEAGIICSLLNETAWKFSYVNDHKRILRILRKQTEKSESDKAP